MASTPASSSSSASRKGAVGAYLRALTTYSMARLEKEPRQLELAIAKLDGDIRRLATDNYDTFMRGAESVRSSRVALDAIGRSLDSVEGKVPELGEQCSAFASEAARIREAQSVNKAMVENQYRLLEVLEIPQLVNSCARVGMYDEALGLDAHVRALRKRHPDVEVLEDIAAEIRGTMRLIVSQLLRKLEGQLQLPVCLRVIGYLRRMGVFEERQLRAQFLRSRDAWLEAAIAAIPDDDSAYEYVTKYLNVNRVHLFEIVHQYRAIFADASDVGEAGERGLLAFWVHHHVLAIVATIADALERVDDASFVANILEQCMYCGLSLSRVGVDFRGLLPPLFARRMLEIFKAQIASNARAFEESLRDSSWHVDRKTLVKLEILGPRNGDSGNDGGLGSATPGQTPALEKILEYPPLVTLLNGLIAAFNDLRQCPPHAIRAQVARAVIRRLDAALSSLRDAVMTPAVYSESERSAGQVEGLTGAFETALLPHVQLLVDRVFGGTGRAGVEGAGHVLDTADLATRVRGIRRAHAQRTAQVAAQEARERKEREAREAKALARTEARKFTKKLRDEMRLQLKSSSREPLVETKVRAVFDRAAATDQGNAGDGSLSRQGTQRLFARAAGTASDALRSLFRDQLNDQLCSSELEAVAKKIAESSLVEEVSSGALAQAVGETRRGLQERTSGGDKSEETEPKETEPNIRLSEIIATGSAVAGALRVSQEFSDFVAETARKFESGRDDGRLEWKQAWDISRVLFYKFGVSLVDNGTFAADSPAV